MNQVRPLLFSTFVGYVASYSLGSIWFYHIQEQVFRPIDRLHVENPNHSFGDTAGIFFSGWHSILGNFYGYTDYEEEVKTATQDQAASYKVDKY